MGICSKYAPLSMENLRQEYKNGLPFPSSVNLPDPGIEPGSPALRWILNRLTHPSSVQRHRNHIYGDIYKWTLLL